MLGNDNGYDTMGFEITPQVSGQVTRTWSCAGL
jgi:hypothetical protein